MINVIALIGFNYLSFGYKYLVFITKKRDCGEAGLLKPAEVKWGSKNLHCLY